MEALGRSSLEPKQQKIISRPIEKFQTEILECSSHNGSMLEYLRQDPQATSKAKLPLLTSSVPLKDLSPALNGLSKTTMLHGNRNHDNMEVDDLVSRCNPGVSSTGPLGITGKDKHQQAQFIRTSAKEVFGIGSWKKFHSMEPDVDLLDSASSTSEILKPHLLTQLKGVNGRGHDELKQRRKGGTAWEIAWSMNLLDKDMSSYFGRWLDFLEVEAFELGTQIEKRLLNSLIDEVVADILLL
ncbi:hypothetical protein HAX54_037046 [Datura stramonium]|uniref:DUF4378 domain-containing protein n=1 Tax=Datura stramonium TaxID=4076 RepID=A0ABS8VJE8_DATST|nr:hypothetical protein [Datura stramonium]